MGWLEDQTAIITGATSGIGKAVLERYIEEGANVVFTARTAEQAKDLEQRFPGRVEGVVGDVRDPATHAKTVERALEAYGGLDILVPNAGIFDFFKSLESFDAASLSDTFDEIFAINVKGYLFAAHAARDALKASKGCIIFTSSIAGFHANCAGIVYTAAKHAIIGIVRQLAFELAPEVRVNSVAPGGTLAPLKGPESLGQSDRSVLSVPKVGEMIAESVPLGFAQQPEHHSGLYVLLASRRDAPAVTGQVFMSDGGVGVRAV